MTVDTLGVASFSVEVAISWPILSVYVCVSGTLPCCRAHHIHHHREEEKR